MFLAGKVAVVTGSTSGIGLAVARALAGAGAAVVVNGFGPADEVEAIRAELAASGAPALYDAADLADPAQAAGLVARAVAELGGCDVLVNNAGVQYVAPIADFPVAEYDRIIAVNLSAPWHLTRAAIPAMRAKGWGRIVTIASAHSLVASPNKSAYVMAKHGVAGLTKAAALEVAGDGITVNAVSPGYVWTPLVERQIPDTARARGMTPEQVMTDVLLAAQPTKRFVTVEEVAALVLFLCGEAARSITGANLSVDGGWTAA